MIFNAVADALAFIIKRKGEGWLEHYLDDFVVLGPPNSDKCRSDLKVALETCGELCMPVAEEKTMGPATVLALLGVELDSELLQLRLSPGSWRN